MRIELSHATLRPWRAEDADDLALFANNRKIWRNLRDLFPHPYSRDDGVRYIQMTAERERSGAILLAIEVEGRAAGGIGVHPFDDVYRQTAELGYWLGEPFWGRGIISQAVAAVTPLAFEQRPIVRLQAAVYSWNPASARVLEKCGYRLEGIRRRAITKDGVLLDEHLYVSFASCEEG